MSNAKQLRREKKSKQQKHPEMHMVNTHAVSSSRVQVKKTYKLYINGAFPRTESGHSYPVYNYKKEIIAHLCKSSRKDFREAVCANRGSLASWSAKSAFLRSQIMYRIAEMLEARRDQFIGELQELGSSKKSAETEVNHSIDTIVYYAGWADKYQQVFSSVNPVASSHFNFSLYEPMGVIALVAPEDSALLGLVQALMPILTGGNTCTILASESKALCAMSFAEVLHSSDVPAGVVNILTGSRADLLEHMSTHMDVNALVVHDLKKKEFKEVEIWSCTNLKRLITRNSKDFELSPHPILETQELKTTWHPIGT